MSWYRQISCTYCDSLLSSFAGPYRMLFLLLSIHTTATFFVLFGSLWERVDHYIVDLLFILLPHSIFSVLPGTVHGLSTSHKSSLFVLLVFSTSPVGTLWVYSCYGQSFRSLLKQNGLSFCHPFCYICFLLAFFHFDSQSVMDGSGLFKSRTHICHHCLAFSNSVHFCVLFWVNPTVFSLLDFLQVPVILFPCNISLQSFSIVLFVPIFNSKIVLLFWHPVVALPSLFAGRYFFSCFGISCFIYIVWFFLDIFVFFFLSPLPSHLFELFAFLSVACSFYPKIFPRFPLFLAFLQVEVSFSCVSTLIFHYGLEFLSVFYRGTSILSDIFLTCIDQLS